MTKVGKIDSFAHVLVDSAIKEVFGAKMGFITNECTFVKTLLKGIGYRTITSSNVLDETSQYKFDNLLRKLTYE